MVREEKLKFEGRKGMPIIKADGSAEKNYMGNWGNYKPIIDRKKCVLCKLCYAFCPEGAIRWVEGKPVYNYHTCKRCLVCFHECPVKAIYTEKER